MFYQVANPELLKASSINKLDFQKSIYLGLYEDKGEKPWSTSVASFCSDYRMFFMIVVVWGRSLSLMIWFDLNNLLKFGRKTN